MVYTQKINIYTALATGCQAKVQDKKLTINNRNPVTLETK